MNTSPVLPPLLRLTVKSYLEQNLLWPAVRRSRHLLSIGSYALLTVILTYPVAFRLTSAIAGFAGEDNLQWRWFLWWFKHALLNLHSSITHVSLLYAPTGGEQPLYAITSFIPAVALPFTLLSGPTLGFNLSFLLSFILTGYTTFLLVYYLTRRALAGFLAGLIFAFYPARFGYGTGTFLGQLTTYFLPLYILALFMLARRPTWHRAGWTGLVLAGLCLTWPLHVAYGVVVFTLPFLAVQSVTWVHRPETRSSFKYFALAFALAFALVLGLYLPLVQSFLAGENSYLSQTDSTYFALDLLAFLTPSRFHPLLTTWQLMPAYVNQILVDRNDIQERLAYIGLVPALLAVIGLARFRRQLLFWFIIALAAMILSLGPLLKFRGELVQLDIDGYVSFIVLPYAFLRSLPVLDWSGVVGRLNVATMLCLAVMAGHGSLPLLARLKSRWQPALVVVLSGLILAEFLTIFPFPAEPDVVPAYYYRLRQEAATRPQRIIDLPLEGDPIYGNYSMYYQTVHEQPIAGGHFMRKPAGAVEMVSFLNRLLSPPPAQHVVELPDLETRLGLLHQFGFTRVIARLGLMQAENAGAQLAFLTSWLGQPRSEGEVSVFEISVAGGRAPPPVIVLLDGKGWSTADNEELQLQAPADLLVYVDSSQPAGMALQLSVSAPGVDRYLVLGVDERPAARLYLSQERLDYALPISLAPGFHRLTFFPDEACPEECQPVDFAGLAIASLPPAEASINFGDRLTLTHVELPTAMLRPEQPLLAYLYWQGQRRLEADYSLFVHLVSPSGKLVGQVDYLLGDWLYPTSAWPEGYSFAMPVLLFVPPDAAPGNYQLRVGLYDSETGVRLHLNADPAQPDFAVLATVEVAPPDEDQ